MRAPSTVAICVIVAFACLDLAAAAALPTTVARFAGGTATVSACDPNGFAFRHTVDTTGRITTVTVSSIAAACAGGTLRLTLTNGTTSVGAGSAMLPSVGFAGSAALAISPAPVSSQVTALYMVIEGP
jgi:hypothetical protein